MREDFRLRRKAFAVQADASVAAEVRRIVAEVDGYFGLKGRNARAQTLLCLVAGTGSITVNAIAPALIETEMVTSNPNASPNLTLTPMGHFGAVDDVASDAVMLAMNDYMTGQTISVNGGWYMT